MTGSINDRRHHTRNEPSQIIINSFCLDSGQTKKKENQLASVYGNKHIQRREGGCIEEEDRAGF